MRMFLTLNAEPISLRKKLILIVIVCMVVPSAVAVLLTAISSKKTIKNHMVLSAAQNLELVDQYMSEFIKKMIYVSNSIQFDTEITSILIEQSRRREPSYGHEGDWESFRKVNQKLENIALSDGDTRISILLSNGLRYTNYSHSEYDPIEFLQEPWLLELNNIPAFEMFWLGIHSNYLLKNNKENPFMITISKALKRSSPEPYGYMIISISERHFGNMLNNDMNQNMILLDENNMILSHNDVTELGRYFNPDYIKKIGDGHNEISWNGEKYIMLERKLSYSRWKLVNLMSFRELTQPINSIQFLYIIVQIIFFIVFLLAIIFMIRKVTVPLVNLSRTARKVEEGNLNVRSYIRGSDEIGQLGYSFDRMLDKVEDMIIQVKLEQEQKSRMEYRMLQAQIHPHFLFNILNSIRLRIILKGDDESAEVISALSSLLRMTFQRGKGFITLHEEVDTIVNYAKILNFRRKENVSMDIQIPSDCLLIKVPGLCLQPIIENAFVHGLRQRPGRITIKAVKERDVLIISVLDNGQGMSMERLQNIRQMLNYDRFIDEGESSTSSTDLNSAENSGIGLINVYHRMLILYGSDFKIKLESSQGEGTSITLRIPYRRK